jgi:hypothetical protein
MSAQTIKREDSPEPFVMNTPSMSPANSTISNYFGPASVTYEEADVKPLKAMPNCVIPPARFAPIAYYGSPPHDYRLDSKHIFLSLVISPFRHVHCCRRCCHAFRLVRVATGLGENSATTYKITTKHPTHAALTTHTRTLHLRILTAKPFRIRTRRKQHCDTNCREHG